MLNAQKMRSSTMLTVAARLVRPEPPKSEILVFVRLGELVTNKQKFSICRNAVVMLARPIMSLFGVSGVCVTSNARKASVSISRAVRASAAPTDSLAKAHDASVTDSVLGTNY